MNGNNSLDDISVESLVKSLTEMLDSVNAKTNTFDTIFSGNDMQDTDTGVSSSDSTASSDSNAGSSTAQTSATENYAGDNNIINAQQTTQNTQSFNRPVGESKSYSENTTQHDDSVVNPYNTKGNEQYTQTQGYSDTDTSVKFNPVSSDENGINTEQSETNDNEFSSGSSDTTSRVDDSYNDLSQYFDMNGDSEESEYSTYSDTNVVTSESNSYDNSFSYGDTDTSKSSDTRNTAGTSNTVNENTSSSFNQNEVVNANDAYEQETNTGYNKNNFNSTQTDFNPQPRSTFNQHKPQKVSKEAYSNLDDISVEDLARLLIQDLNAYSMDDKSVDNFMHSEQQERYNMEAKRRVENSRQGFEDILSEPRTIIFDGQPVEYQSYTDEVQFDSRFEQMASDDDTGKSFLKFIENVTKDVENKFGGWERITSLAVVSNLLILNGVSYEPYMPEYYKDYLPFDLRHNLSDGQYAWLFDFHVLNEMTNLSNLMFDNTSFVYDKVRRDIGVVFDFSPATIFRYCKRLQILQIADNVITADNYRELNNLFRRQVMGEKVINTVNDWFWEKTKNNWTSWKDVFLDPDRHFGQKIGSAALWTIPAVLSTAGTVVSHTATKGVPKIFKGAVNFFSKVKRNMK